MGQFRASTFVLRYLLPVIASVIAAPLVVLCKLWPLVRMAILAVAAVCMALIFVLAIAQGH